MAGTLSYANSAWTHGSAHARIEQINEKLKSTHDRASVLVMRGQVYADSQHWSQAMNDFKQVLLMDKNNLEAKYWLGIAYLNTAKYESAKKFLAEYLAHRPKAASALIAYARVLVKLNDFAAAEVAYDNAIENSRVKSPELYIERAEVLSKVGDVPTERIEQGLTAGIYELGNIVSLIDALIEVNYKGQNYDRALYWMDKQPGVYRDSPAWFAQRASIFEAKGDWDAAEQMYVTLLSSIERLPLHRKNTYAIKKLQQEATLKLNRLELGHLEN